MSYYKCYNKTFTTFFEALYVKKCEQKLDQGFSTELAGKKRGQFIINVIP